MHVRLARRALRGIVVAAVFVLIGLASAASAAEQRPNALDRRVDAIPQAALMSQPATALVDQQRQAAALRRAHWTLPAWLLIQFLEAAALFYFWSSGGAAAVRDWLRRRVRSPWNLRFLFGASLALVARAAAFLPEFYLYRVDRGLDLSVELTRLWALDWVLHTILGMIVAGLIAAIVLGLAARSHQWYAYTILAILAACIGWSYISPYVLLPRAHPLSGPLASEVNAVLMRANLPRIPVQVESIADWPVGGADVLGLGASHTILLSEKMVAGSTPPEIEYEVASELGHIAQHDLLWIALIEGGIIIVFAAIAIVIADRVRFRRDDDPLSRLAIVGALLALVYLVAVPVRNAALRSYDFNADQYAVALTGDPAAAVRALVRASDQRMEQVCPELGATLFLYIHPGVGARVEAINHVPARCP